VLAVTSTQCVVSLQVMFPVVIWHVTVESAAFFLMKNV
jgi:hypothetical protein